MPDTRKTFYLTTPIYYVNARPHIGHAYSTIVADVLARRHRLLGDDTYFLTGTDEHGQKIERAAAAAGIPPQQYADQVSKTFSDLWARMGITHDQFIRTTGDGHKQGVQKLFADLYANGQIHLSSYTGQYSVGEEMFVEGPPGTIGPDGRPTETVTEENFFFRLSDYQLPLLNLIESNELVITPESSRNEVLAFLRGNIVEAQSRLATSALGKASVAEGPAPGTPKFTSSPSGETYDTSDISVSAQTAAGTPYLPGALRDLSVSRSSFTWGIPVPEPAASETKQKHVIYVWLDALANYMTALGYGSDDDALWQKFWPADIHLVGKEITRFHCVYWPAFLLALNPKLQHKPDEPTPILSPEEHKAWAEQWLPKQVTANGWLLFDNSKMSKSKGNVVRTETILDAFGTLCPAPQQPSTRPTSAAPEAPSVGPSTSATDQVPGISLTGSSERATNQVPGVSLTGSSERATNQVPGVSLTGSSERATNQVPQGFSLGQDGKKGVVALAPETALKGTGFSPSVDAPKSDAALAAEGDLAEPSKAYRDLFAADILRYYLLREIPFGQDGSFSFDSLITRYNADLANGYGNLVSRTLAMIGKYFGYTIPSPEVSGPFSEELLYDAKSDNTDPGLVHFIETVGSSFGSVESDITRDTTRISRIVAALDQYISLNQPWKDLTGQFGDIPITRATVLYETADAIRIITALLYPILPYATSRVWAQLGLGDIEAAARHGELKNLQWGGLKPGTKLGPLSPIFPRADKGLAQIMTDMENPSDLDTSSLSAVQTPRPEAPLKSAITPAPVAPIPADPTHPAAAPRAISAPTGTLPVAGSAATTTHNGPTPSHTEAQASGIFANAPSKPDTLNPEPSPSITIDDFIKVELRVAQILLAERIPKADKLLRLEVDLGPEGKRQILSGIAEWYTPEDLTGRKIVVITNLAPRKMRGLESHGMLLAASEEGGKPVLATFGEDIPNGTRLK